MISKAILPPARLGVLGGGQLGMYFCLAAQDMGYQVLVPVSYTHLTLPTKA